jgi:hypothetical protein
MTSPTTFFPGARNFQQRKVIGPPPMDDDAINNPNNVWLCGGGCGCGDGGGGACSSNVGMSGGRLENESVRAAAHGSNSLPH